MVKAKGKIVKAFGNLVHVQFQGDILQGEVALIDIDGTVLSSEVIEINGNEAKIQVFEDTRGIKLHTPVEFSSHLLEAELGPGLLTSVFDGLQNPLEKVAEKSGLFLTRGIHIVPLDRQKKWTFSPIAQKEDRVKRGSWLGEVPEGRFSHKIMVPFAKRGEYTITWIASPGKYTIEEPIARAIDESGQEHIFMMLQKWPVKMPIQEGNRIKPSEMMATGLRIIDTQFPVVKGGTFCSPGPFGAGKTVLQHHLSKYSSVDIVIVAACGERAGEVVEILREFPHLVDEKTKEPLINRTVIICNTSSMPVSAREASVYMGVTIGEYYRQMGLDVLLLADSTSRWAQAMREMSGRLEEIPGEEAFPAYLSSRIAAFYERAGVLALSDQKSGSLTIGGTVSPAGGNFEEPVTQSTLAVVGGFLGLSRERSDARRYPAIDPLISWSKYLHRAAQYMLPSWEKSVYKAERFLKDGHEIGKRMEVVGEEGTAIEDMVIFLKSELYDLCYLQQNAFDFQDAYCSLERQKELFELMNKIFDKHFSFETHDEARDFFLKLQNDIKNMNYMPFKEEMYQNMMQKVCETINSR
ncbi:MAG: V-type ATP synthase subunit A [Parachlamydiales bacterium]|nr:V-type ATP synthase subunit A [Parachlamydiales bacterium]